MRIRLIIYFLYLLIGGSVLQAQNRPGYTIYRAYTTPVIDGQLDELGWISAPDVRNFVFPWYKKGRKEQTMVKLLWDDTRLYVAFICEDAHIWATHTQRNSKVYLDDTVEIFIAPNPNRVQAYFNIEMNVLGIFLAGFHPDGSETQNRDEWKSKGIQIKTTIKGTLNDDSDEDSYWILEASIPFKNFVGATRHIPPESGDVWRLNLNRLGGNTNNQYSQWSASQTPTPSFHIPNDFGQVKFSNKAKPF